VPRRGIRLMAPTTVRATTLALEPVLGTDAIPDSDRREPGQAPRLLSGEDMWARVRPHLWDYGLTRVAHLTHLDRIGIPVHMAVKPAGISLASGSGKGVTELASTLSAVMEAIEQTYWETCDPEHRLATQAELAAGDEAFVGYDVLPLNRGHVLTESTPLRWVQLWDVANGGPVWAPLSHITLPLGRRFEQNGVMVSTNGLASGSHVLEAMLSGLMEVIERDAITLAYLTESLRPVAGDDRSSTWAALADRIAAAGLRLTVSECTTDDVGVPTYHARISDPGGGVGDFGGYGAALDSDVAVVRAITEAAQSRCIVVAGARDDIHMLQRRGAVRLAKRPPAVADVKVPARYRPVDLSGRSLVEDLTAAVAQLRRAGLDRVLVHRYSGERDPVQVVRVLVPGLEGYHARTYVEGPRARARLAAAGAAP